MYALITKEFTIESKTSAVKYLTQSVDFNHWSITNGTPNSTQ